jgi:hypothetical protein
MYPKINRQSSIEKKEKRMIMVENENLLNRPYLPMRAQHFKKLSSFNQVSH